MSDQTRIQAYFAGSPHAVVGASNDRSKYGNKVLRAYLQNGRKAFPVNPNADQVEGLTSYPDLASLPEPVDAICIITPPHITETIIEQAGVLGIKNVWLQPGAENRRAISRAESLGMNLIAGGPCILIALRYRE